MFSREILEDGALIREDILKVMREAMLSPHPYRIDPIYSFEAIASGSPYQPALEADLMAEPGSLWEAALKRNGAL